MSLTIGVISVKLKEHGMLGRVIQHEFREGQRTSLGLVEVQLYAVNLCIFFFQAEDGIRDYKVTGVQTCALPISIGPLHGAVVRVLATATGLHLEFSPWPLPAWDLTRLRPGLSSVLDVVGSAADRKSVV